MKKFNFALGTAGVIVSSLVILTITFGPQVGQSFALLASCVTLIACTKLAVDQL